MNGNTQNFVIHQERSLLNTVRAAILGHAVGDALGVSVEFSSRRSLRKRPVTDMVGFGTHNQPPGTWSDDTSLSLCLAQSLCNGYDLKDQAYWFVRWLDESVWTPHGKVFDIGNTTANAIGRLARGIDPRVAGPRDQYSNGNGSLMRILPLAIYLAKENQDDRIKTAMEASCLTHGHIRSQLACAMYTEVAVRLINGWPFVDAFATIQDEFAAMIEKQHFDERLAFHLALDGKLAQRSEDEISGSGYVLHTLSTSFWCCLQADSYESAVLKAVNLGEDTDTTAAVTGGLAGLIYGVDGIPSSWIDQLARIADIERLCKRFADSCHNHWKGET